MEFWPIFDIFHRLRPYYVPNGRFWGSTSRPHIGDVAMSLFFTLGSTVHDWGWPKNGPLWTKNGQTWQAYRRSKVVQKGPKGTKMANLSVFDHLGPFWAHLDPFGPFQTKNDFLLWSTSAKPYFVHLGQKIHFCLKWSKSVQMGPKRSQMVKNTLVDHFGPFWTLLDHFGTLTSLPCLAIFGPKWTIFDASHYGSMVPKWLESWTSHGLSIFRLNGLPFWA